MRRTARPDDLTPALAAAIFCALGDGVPGGAQQAGDRSHEGWTFDRLDRIGGHPTTVLGSPRVIDTPIGRATELDGIDDALFVEVHPFARK